MSTNLNAPALVGGQANPETTTNDAVGALDAALTEIVVVDLTNSATISAANYRAGIKISVTPTGSAKTLTLQAIKRLVLLCNDGTNSITVALGTANFTLAAGASTLIYTDGTANGLKHYDISGSSSQPYDIGLFVPGVMTNSQMLFRFNVDRAFTLPASLTGSICTAGSAATASTVLTIKQNGSSIGTITFSASGTVGAFSFASSVTFAVNDIITIEGPSTADTTLANVAITLSGTR